MKLHPRHDQVASAHNDIATAICEAVRKHGLAYAELVSILAEQIQAWAKSEIRQERLADVRPADKGGTK
jgi:hypothetical protein